MGGNRHHAEKLLPLIETVGGKLKIISEWEANPQLKDRVEYVFWDLFTVRRILQSCRVGIAPQDVSKQPCKSNVKITLYMSCDLLVIASPLRAYKDIIVNDENGWLVDSKQQWLDTLNVALNCTEEFREKILHNARLSLAKYSPSFITNRWLATVHQCLEMNKRD